MTCEKNIIKILWLLKFKSEHDYSIPNELYHSSDGRFWIDWKCKHCGLTTLQGDYNADEVRNLGFHNIDLKNSKEI